MAEEAGPDRGEPGTVFSAGWPEYDEEAAKDDSIKLPVQINGKTKAVIEVAADASKDDVLAAAKQAVEGKAGNIVKEIYVRGKIGNLVVK